MKLIKAFIHHVRTAAVVDALADAGYRNLTLQDVRGMTKPITEDEQDYSIDGGGLLISEERLSLVVDDHEVDAVAAIIGTYARHGMGQSGMISVSPTVPTLPIGRNLPL